MDTMLSFTYVHSHDCSAKSQLVTTYPRISGDSFYEIVPRCVHNGAELELIEQPEHFNG